jgi:two-component system, cell cycle response regulator
MKVLVADDHPVTRKMLQAKLKKWGYEVISAKNGLEALGILCREDAPRLVILDWMMPEMDGLNLCREIRKSETQPYVYVILLTARNKPDDIVSGLEAGADDYIVKPFDPHELRVRIRAGSRVVQLQDDLLAAVKALEFQASHDPLTRLLNRAAILNLVNREVARSQRDGSPVSAIIADVDLFKRINDGFGHMAGDAVLRDIAERLTRSVRVYDSVGRYGGEEFVIVAPATDEQEACVLAERLRCSFEAETLTTSEGDFRITISFGVASSRQFARCETDSLIRAADKALYIAKSMGRNCVQVWRPLSEG